MIYRDFFNVPDTLFDDAEVDKPKDCDIKSSISKSAESLHPGDVVIHKGNIAGIQSVRRSIVGGTTIEMVNKNGKVSVLPAKDMNNISIVKSGKSLNEKSLDLIPNSEVTKDITEIKDAISNIGGNADLVIEKLDGDDGVIANKVMVLASEIQDIQYHMQETGLNRSGMSAYKVNTV